MWWNKNLVKHKKSVNIISMIVANNYLSKVSNRNTRKRPDICFNLTMKIPERRHWSHSGVFIITLSYFTLFPSFPIVDFQQVNICWENYLTFYSFDICFNVPTGGRQVLTRSNAGNFVNFLIWHTHLDVTLASLRFTQIIN